MFLQASENFKLTNNKHCRGRKRHRDLPGTATAIITSNCIPVKPGYLKACLKEGMWVKTCHCSTENIHFITHFFIKKTSQKS